MSTNVSAVNPCNTQTPCVTPIRRHMLAVDDSSLEIFESAGKGTPIFFFHSNSSAADSFEAILRSPLGQRHRMISVSFPGHGGSSPAVTPTNTYTIEMLGRLAAKIVAAYGSPRYFLVGHSLGGHALLEALDHFPGGLGLLLISAPPISIPTLGQAFKPDPSGGCLFKGELTEVEVDGLAACFVSDISNAAFDAIRRNIDRTDRHFRPALGASIGQGLLRDERVSFSQAKLPIALLAGSEDKFLNSEYYSILPEEKLWTGRVLTFEGCGHALHLEAPSRFESLLAAFILDCTGE